MNVSIVEINYPPYKVQLTHDAGADIFDAERLKAFGNLTFDSQWGTLARWMCFDSETIRKVLKDVDVVVDSSSFKDFRGKGESQNCCEFMIW